MSTLQFRRLTPDTKGGHRRQCLKDDEELYFVHDCIVYVCNDMRMEWREDEMSLLIMNKPNR